MANKTGDFELLGRLYVERGVEAHLEVSLVVLVEDAQETLFENRRGKRIGQHDDSTRRIRERLHLEETDLIETSREEIDAMAIVRRAFGECFVEL